MKVFRFLSFVGDHTQDSYCLRCIPQVHGVVIDTLEFVRGILKTEVNSTLDNPVCQLLSSCRVNLIVCNNYFMCGITTDCVG